MIGLDKQTQEEQRQMMNHAEIRIKKFIRYQTLQSFGGLVCAKPTYSKHMKKKLQFSKFLNPKFLNNNEKSSRRHFQENINRQIPSVYKCSTSRELYFERPEKKKQINFQTKTLSKTQKSTSKSTEKNTKNIKNPLLNQLFQLSITRQSDKTESIDRNLSCRHNFFEDKSKIYHGGTFGFYRPFTTLKGKRKKYETTNNKCQLKTLSTPFFFELKCQS